MRADQASPGNEDGRGDAAVLLPYVPTTCITWPAGTDVRVVDGSLVSADISGFTALAERLAGLGREGSEELTAVLNGRLAAMIAWVHAHDGDILKFGGDALLCLFEGDGHEDRAVLASAGMRATLVEPVRSEFGGEIQLSVSIGINTGPQHLFLLDTGGHDELIVAGPGPSATVAAESASSGGRLFVSKATAAGLTIPHELSEVDGWHVVDVPTPDDPTVADPRDLTVSPDVRLVPDSHRRRLDEIGPGIGEHRRAVLLFAECGGVDDLLASHGEQHVHQELHQLLTAIGAACDEHDVQLVSTDVTKGGFKLIMAAGAMGAGGSDHATGALLVATAATTVRTPFTVRVGVNAGPIFVGDLGGPTRRALTVMGDAVNLAARLMGKAEPHAVVAHASVLEAASLEVQHTSLAPFTVKGKSLPVRASTVHRVTDRPADRGPALHTADGRAEELAALSSAWHLARRGTVGVVVRATAGMGKERLLTSFLESVQAPVHAGAGHQRRATRPHAAIAPLLRSALGIDADGEQAAAALLSLASSLPSERVELLPLVAAATEIPLAATSASTTVRPEFVRDQTGLLLLELLDTVATDPMVLVLRDAHHADSASRELFAWLLRHGGRRPWLGLATSQRALDELALLEQLPLGPLPDDVIRRIVLDAASQPLTDPQVDLIVARSAGNPLYAAELAGAVGAGGELPETIDQAMRLRLDRLSPGDRLAVSEAAALGNEGPTSLVASVSPAFAELGWDDVVDVLERDGELFRFRHDLLRQAAYDALPYRHRRVLHGRYAEAMDAYGAPADTLSLHYDLARRPEAWRWSVIAAEQAEAASAMADAATLYRRAVEAAERTRSLDPTEVARVTELYADACEVASRFDEAREAYATARERFEHELAADARITGKLAILDERQARYDEAIAQLTTALERVEREAGAGALVLGVDTRLRLAGVQYRRGDYDDAELHATTAARGARHAADARSIAHAYLLLDTVAMFKGEESNYGERAANLFNRAGDALYEAHALNNLGTVAYFRGRWSEALDRYASAGMRYRDVGDVRSAALARNNVGEVLSDQWRLDEAQEAFAAATRGFEATGYEMGRLVTLANRGRLWARAGNLIRANEDLTAAIDGLVGIGARYYEQVARLRLAEVLADAGSATGAAGQLAEIDGEGGDPTLLVGVDRLRAVLQLVDGTAVAAVDEQLAEVAARATEASVTYDAAVTMLLRGALGDAEQHDRGMALMASLDVLPTVRAPGLGLISA